MHYRYLGKTGLKVSELCLGAMTFGADSDEKTSFELLDRFAEGGGNFVDTANVYSTGTSETVLGKWLSTQPRDKWIIATKARFEMGHSPNEQGLSRHHLLKAVDDSLRRLQTDYIDLYQVHAWDNRTPLEETLSTLNRLVEVGKVRYIGVSNYKAYQIQKAIDLSRANGWEAYVSLQPLYNLLDRSIEWEIVELCQAEGIGIIPWSPLRGGWLTGKFKRGMTAPLEGTRIDQAEKGGWSERWSAYNNERTWAVIDALIAVAEAVGKTPAQVALNWVKDRPAVTAPIVGARTVAQLTDNLGSLGWTLSAEHLATLNTVSEMDAPYPYGEYSDWGKRD